MKQKVINILIICLLCVSLAACQPTPENAAVVNRNEGVLEEKINQEASGAPSFNIPDSINEVVKTDKYSIEINAAVEKLTLDKYPVYSIAPDDFTQEQVDTAIKYFFKDSPLYSQNYTKSKSMIEEEIVQRKAELQKMDGSNPDDIEATETSIKELEKQYDSAPETVIRTQVTSKLTVPSDVDYEMMDAFADLGHTELSSISAYNMPIFQTLSIRIDPSRYFVPFASLDGKNPEGQIMTSDEAKKKAEEALADMGIADMTAVETETGMTEDQSKQGYVVTFKRSVNGVPVAYNIILKTGDKIDMAAEWPSDQIKIHIDDEGISDFNWTRKGKIQKQLTANVEMLTFEEIMDIARQQFKNKFAWNDTSANSSIKTRVVESIVLQYTCAQQKDNPNNYLLIPAWNFYTNTEEDKIRKNYYCILSLNAVDGSVID